MPRADRHSPKRGSLPNRLSAGLSSAAAARQTSKTQRAWRQVQSRRFFYSSEFFPSAEHGLLTVEHVYLITLSARAKTLGGIVRPICLAVLRLMVSSNLSTVSTRRSPGF